MANRTNIYYWKCDRPQAFYAIDRNGRGNSADIEKRVGEMLTGYFGELPALRPAGGQGNHLTFLADHAGKTYFIRIENGPDGDDYMEVEASVIERVRAAGVPTPHIYAVDSSRRKVPFAYQIMEKLESSDLNRIYRQGRLATPEIMRTLGGYVAHWQTIAPAGFGPFDAEELRRSGTLRGLHTTYRDYYTLNLKKHLAFLVTHDFLTRGQSQEIVELIGSRLGLLDIGQGCLVHKDLALWNVMGTCDKIQSVIDWDDAVAGDPTDDLSLMACFHSGSEIQALIEGYRSVRPLPENFEPRFWLHLLRNMLFKAVIRVGAGYFQKNSDFFLSDDGDKLEIQTRMRIDAACEGLKGNFKMDQL